MSTAPPRQFTAVLAVTITSLLWGTTGTAATFAPSVGPIAIGAAALGIGGLLQALVVLPTLRRHRTDLVHHWRLIAMGAVAVMIYPLAFYSSMHLAGVAIGTTISLASAPLIAGVMHRLTTRHPLSRWWLTSAGLGTVGSVLLCAATMNNPDGNALHTVAGIGLGLIAGLTYAGYASIVGALLSHGLPRGAAMGSVFGGGGLLLIPVLLITGAPLLETPHTFAVAAYMALLPMFLGYLLFGYGLTRLSAATATTITLSEPAIATLLAILIVGEQLSPLGWTGLALIGLVLVIVAVAPADSPPTAITEPPAHR